MYLPNANFSLNDNPMLSSFGVSVSLVKGTDC